MRGFSSFLITFGITLIGAALGWLIGQIFDEPEIGLIGGAIIFIPLGIALVSRRRRFTFIIFLNLFFVLSYILGGPMGLALSVASSLLTWIFASVVYRGIFDDDILRALEYQTRFALGLLNPPQIIADGITVFPRNAGQLFGPRLLIIKPENAAVVEQGSRQTAILGPEVYMLGPFEYVRQIQDLRTRTSTFRVRDVLTRDGIPVDISMTIAFGLTIRPERKRGLERLSDGDRAVLQRLDIYWQDWEESTVAVVQGRTRLHARSFTLSGLLGTESYVIHEQGIQEESNRACEVWNVFIHRVTLSSIEPVNDISTAKVDRWVANERAKSAVTTERARSIATRDMLKIIADGYRIAADLGMTDEEIYREVLRHTLEQVAKDPATKIVSIPEISLLLDSLGR